MNKLSIFNKNQMKTGLPELKSGDTVRVHQIIKEKDKERIQIFEGVIIAIKHGKGATATFTVRKMSEGIGVEKTFPLHSPIIKKIEVLKHAKTRRAKLYYIREKAAKEIRKKMKHFRVEAAPVKSSAAEETPKEEVVEKKAE